jgi:proteasome lid subunit RPN8/RPN11
LLGTAERIRAIRPAANVAAEPGRAFELDPAVLIAAHRAARAGGEAILGHYHSHPGGDPQPSACDAAAVGAAGELWLVVAGREARLWRAVAGGPVHGAFAAEAMAVG